MSRKNLVYVSHTCKNKQCQRAFNAEDLYNAKNKPPSWRYCQDCKALGYKSIKNKTSLKNLQGTTNFSRTLNET